MQLDGLDRDVLLDVEEAEHVPEGALVVAAEVVVDQHQQLLAREQLFVAAQLLDIADAVRVDQRHRPYRAVGDVAAFAAGVVEAQRGAKVPLGLVPVADQLQVQRAQERRRLAQDADHAGGRLDLGDPPRRAARPQVGRGGLPGTLVCPSGSEQRQVVLEALLAHPRLVERAPTGTLGPFGQRVVDGEVVGLLDLGHVDLGVAGEHLVQRSGPALGLPRDEEIRQPQAGRGGRLRLLSRHRRTPRRTRGPGPGRR